jgi:hypothetical protein
MHFIGCHVEKMEVQWDVMRLGREAVVSFTIERLKGA